MRKTVLITGASGGIGYELAKLFAKNGHDLVIIARNRDKLSEIKRAFEKDYSISVKVIEKDLSEPSSPQEIFEMLQNDHPAVDILVNNAGFGNYGFFSETELREELEMIQLNITSLTHLTKLFLKEMIRRRSGRILNVASTAAFQPGPLMSVYYASKAYVLSFSEALSNELKGSGVTVTVLCPGLTKTGFQKRANIEGTKLVSSGLIMSAKAVAQTGYQALMKGKTLAVPGFMNKAMIFLVRFGPRSLVTKIVRFIQGSKQ